MKKSVLWIVLSAMVAGMVLAGCGAKKEEEAGFDNSKPVPAEDGGGAKAN